MSKFLALGLSLEEVVARATVEPAKIIGRVPGLGTLTVGAPADVAIFDYVDGPSVEFVDTRNNRKNGTKKLVPVLTVKGGRPYGRPYPAPFVY
jgi:dihydroorotase